MSKSRSPAHEYRVGPIRATIWPNEAASSKVWYRISIVKSYRDGDSWKETTSFGRDDLPLVSKAADLAFAWIWDNGNGRSGDQ